MARPRKPRQEKKPKRRANGTFSAGNCANPGGRPKKNKVIETLVQSLIEDPIEGTHLVFDRLVKIVETGANRDAIDASKLLLEYAYGKPRQRLEVGGPGNDDSVQVLVIGKNRIEF